MPAPSAGMASASSNGLFASVSMASTASSSRKMASVASFMEPLSFVRARLQRKSTSEAAAWNASQSRNEPC